MTAIDFYNKFLGDPNYIWFQKDIYPNESTTVFSSDVGITAITHYVFHDVSKNTVEFSGTMFILRDVLLARIPQAVKRRDTLTRPFGHLTWIVLFVTMFCCILFVLGHTYFAKTQAEYSYGEWFLHMVACLFQEPDTSLIYMKSDGLRLFIIIFLAMTFILSSSYAGTLVSFLSIPSKIPFMKTLKDVALSGLPLVQYTDVKEAGDPNVWRDMILKRTFEDDSPPTLLPRALKGELIIFGNYMMLSSLINDDKKR